MMITEVLIGALGQMLGELLGELLENPVERVFANRALNQALRDAVARAEMRFGNEYRAYDAELADALVRQTRFADLPSVQAALRELLTQPFRSPQPYVATLQHSFGEVLPERIDRGRVDAAVSAFLHILGQEVLIIPQLRELYGLAFQKTSAESSRLMASHTAALVHGIDGLRADIKQLGPPSATPLLTAAHAALQRPRPWHNLPQRSYHHFVGRQAELAKLAQLLQPYPRSRHFLVTLDGIGGVGKSALAIEFAYGYRDNYNALPPSDRFDAIVWASAKRTLLTANGIQQRTPTFSTLDDLYREIATVLDDPAILQSDPYGRRTLVDRALTQQRTLLIVDNLETVDDEALLSFLRDLPDPTKVIVTTRHRIDIAYAIRLSGMPRADALVLIGQEAATRGVVLPAGSDEELFRRTGGLPLAIVWSMALMSLGYGVESVLRRLGQGHSDIARFCFAASVDRIRERDAYRLLLTLALFEAHVSRTMLGVIAGLNDDVIGRDDGLAELLQLSLANQKGERFFLLPLTQSYALDELGHQPALEGELRERWVAHLTELARPYAALSWQQPDRRIVWQEGPHFLTLAMWAQQHAAPDTLLQVLPALASSHIIVGRWGEMFSLGQLGLAYARLIGDSISMIFINTHILAWVLNWRRQHAEAEACVAEAVAIAQEIHNIAWQCETLQNYAKVLRFRKEFDRAEACCEAVLNVLPDLEETHQRFARADIIYELGKIARDRGDFETANQHFLTARNAYYVENAITVPNAVRYWEVLANLGYVAHQLGDHNAAALMYRQALDFYETTGSKGYTVILLTRLAALEEAQGDDAMALAHAREALKWSERLGMAPEQQAAAAIVERLNR